MARYTRVPSFVRRHGLRLRTYRDQDQHCAALEGVEVHLPDRTYTTPIGSGASEWRALAALAQLIQGRTLTYRGVTFVAPAIMVTPTRVPSKHTRVRRRRNRLHQGRFADTKKSTDST